MCHNNALLITMGNYTGIIHDVIFGDGTTTTPICDIGTIRSTTSKGHTVRLYNVVYVSGLNVSLCSIKQQMKYDECYEHSQHNFYRLTFPTFILPVDNNDKPSHPLWNLILTRVPYQSTLREITMLSYLIALIMTVFIEVTISLSLKIKPVSFPPSALHPPPLDMSFLYFLTHRHTPTVENEYCWISQCPSHMVYIDVLSPITASSNMIIYTLLEALWILVTIKKSRQSLSIVTRNASLYLRVTQSSRLHLSKMPLLLFAYYIPSILLDTTK